MRRPPVAARRRPWAAWFLGCILPLAAFAASPGTLGLPFTRAYSFEEIGKVSRGAQLGFDRLGRLVVSRGGACVALNDTAWTDLADHADGNPVMENIVFDDAGDAYYCAFGSWGTVRMQDGKLKPFPLMPATVPKWIATANFNAIVALPRGVYFGSLSGFVYWDRATGQHTFFDIPSVARIFMVGDTLFVSSHLQGLSRLDPGHNRLVPVPDTQGPGLVIDQAVEYGRDRALVSTTDGRLFLFDGSRFTPFPGLLGNRGPGRLSTLRRMSDGNYAIAINGAGVYIASPEGEILTALTTPEYHRVTDLAAHENGVLWVVTENGVEKILYNSALTSFGQRQGLPLSWPQLVTWRDRVIVASGGRLYETVRGLAGDTTRFDLVPDQPESQIWGVAAAGRDLLFGTNQGVYARTGDGRTQPVLLGVDAARIVPVGDIFLVLGATEIAALRRDGERWVECAPRAPGVGYPLVVHATAYAAWIELGPNRAARVRWRDGRIDVRLFENFPWKTPRWINVGWAGDLVALSGMPDGRIFFNDRTESFVEHPPLERVLAQAPYPILRFRQDEAGTLWAMHEQGLLTIKPQQEHAEYDATTYGRIDGRFPLATFLPGGEIWISTGQSLYHVNRDYTVVTRPPYKPVLVSLTDGRSGRELLSDPAASAGLPRLTHEQNSPVLRFFAGSYASREAPIYDFKLHRGDNSWVTVGDGSLLALTDLREGDYRLEVRVADARESVGEKFVLDFSIAPPWYRTWLACSLFAIAAMGGIAALVRWSGHRTRAQNLALERLVMERTNELRVAMQQLNEETRNAATVAERNRLAGEIHDSLQQGLSGLMLVLDATLKMPELTTELRNRLIVARNMVSFTRHEVQHAVWDMETPLLEGTELGEALRKIAALIDPGTARVEFEVRGRSLELSPATKHHLLRLAQEALTNAVRHAAAEFIRVTLAYEPAEVVLTVSDDGNGFFPDDILKRGFGHFGLRGMRSRAAKIGAEVRIDSAPGRGTLVTVRVPLSAATPSHANLAG